MLDEKKAHIFFRSLFVTAGLLAVACFVFANLKKLSLAEIRIIIVLELVLLGFFLALVLTIKLQWDIQYIDPNEERIDVSKEDMFLLILSGVAFLGCFVLACTRNRQYLYSALFLLLSYVSVFWDVKFVRPRMK